MDEKDLDIKKSGENEPQGAENESNAAKRIRLLGIESEDKIHDESATINKGNFFSNLWYQHKWGIIIGAILVITAVVFIVSVATKPKYDMYVAYAGPLYMDIDTKNAIEFAFTEMSRDYDNNGEELLNFASITYQNPDQMEELGSTEDIREAYGAVMQSHENYKALDTIRSQMMSGTVAIYLMDEKLYKDYEASMLSLSELAGKELDTEIMAGESGVYFKKTDFYRYMYNTEEGRALKSLPDDTVLCILPKLQTMDDDLHESSKELIKSILEFELE